MTDVKELHKAFKVRLMPTDKQEEQFRKNAGCARKVYNWALAEKIEGHKSGIGLSKFDITNYLTEFKSKNKYLYECHASTLQSAVRDMDSAFSNFFKSCSGERKGRQAGYPKFKSLHKARRSFRIIQTSQKSTSIRIDEDSLKIPKVGFVEVANAKNILDRFKDFRIIYVTISQDSDRNWYASVLCVVPENQVKTHTIEDTKAVIGLDAGVRTTVVDSNGGMVDIPKEIFRLKKRIKILQKQQSVMRGPNRKKKIQPSNNWVHMKDRIGMLHFRIKSIRADWQHKLSMKLVKENAVIVMETLDIQGMSKHKGVSKSDFNDKVLAAAWFQLKTFIKYKAEWYGRRFVEVSKYFPSSKLCSVCGHYNRIGMLKGYTCGKCYTIHDRDENAAVNLQTVGYYWQATGELIKTGVDYRRILSEKTA